MSIQHANRGVVKKDLHLYYNREWVKSFRGEATTNFILQTENLTSNWTGNLFNNWINATVTANADLAPNGSLTASKLTGGYSRWTDSITVSASVTYTASVWLKNINLGVDPAITIATGLNGTLVSYVVADSIISRSTIANWRRVYITYTIPASGVNQIQFGIRYNNDYPNQNSILVWGAQFEQKAYASTYLANSSGISISRTNTVAGGGGLLDISGNNVNADLTNVVFDSGGYSFTSAGNNYLNTGITTLPSNTQLTIDVWTKPTSTTQQKTLVSKWGSSAQFNFCFLLFLNWFAQGNIYFLVGSANGDGYSNHSIPHNLSTSAYTNYTIVYDNGNISWYRNGIFIQTETNGNQRLRSINTPITIGADFDGGNPDTLTRNYDGTIPNVRLYSRPLTAIEVLQNFNATRTTYGI